MHFIRKLRHLSPKKAIHRISVLLLSVSVFLYDKTRFGAEQKHGLTQEIVEKPFTSLKIEFVTFFFNQLFNI